MIDPYQRIYLQANKAAHDMPDHAHSVESADMHELAWFAGKHFLLIHIIGIADVANDAIATVNTVCMLSGSYARVHALACGVYLLKACVKVQANSVLVTSNSRTEIR